MTHRTSLYRLRLPPSTRLFSVLLALVAYHGSLLHTPQPSPSPFPSPSSSSFPSSSSPSSPSSSTPAPCSSSIASTQAAQPRAKAWWPWWGDQPPEGEGAGTRVRAGAGAGAAAGELCVLNREQQRLTEMLNELQTVEELDPGRLALQQIWMRDNHNLTGVCPTFRPGGYPYLPGLERQSLCPWTLEQNYRTDRFPRLLWFARCLCGHCTGGTRGFGGAANLYSCVPLYHRVAVIREVCQDGEIHFRWGRESVPVGCVCAHPTARQVP